MRTKSAELNPEPGGEKWMRGDDHTELPNDAPVGKYPITHVSAIDLAGNQTLIGGSELEAEPWDLSFENLP